MVFHFPTSHASELVFTLHFDPLLITLDDRRVGRTTTQYWTTFAGFGNPNSVGTVNWPRFVAGNNEQSLFLSANTTAITNFYKAQCDLWDTVSDVPPRDSELAFLESNLQMILSKI